MKVIHIVFLFAFTFFCFIANGEMTNRDFNLYCESVFFKDGKKFRVPKLSLEQSQELEKILSKYDLSSEGETKDTHPFAGAVAIFRITINKKAYALSMVNNTKHIFPEDEHKSYAYKGKLFWMQRIGRLGKIAAVSRDDRIFESAALYLELEKFLEKYAVPVSLKNK